MLKSLQARLSLWNRDRRRSRGDDSDKPNRLAVMAIMKNEAMNLDEWIEHYLWQGADKIVLIDNGSTDDTVAVAQRWVNKGLVSLISLPKQHRQRQHYWTAFRRFDLRRTCRWLLVADLDEFWYCPDGRTVAQALHHFDGQDVVYVNWALFSSAGHDAHPRSLRVSLTKRSPHLSPHISTKYLCRTRIIRRRRNLDIHKVKSACSSKTVSDNTVFRINHYITQSREFFAAVKMTRGDALSAKSDFVRHWQYFESVENACTVEDRALADQVLALSAPAQMARVARQA